MRENRAIAIIKGIAVIMGATIASGLAIMIASMGPTTKLFLPCQPAGSSGGMRFC